MSLVAYADSDCDSDEENGEVIMPSTDVVKIATKTISSRPFLTLPEPKSIENIKTIDDYDSLDKENPVVQTKLPIVNSIQDKKEIPLFPTLPKPKTGGKVKIIIPSLNEFYDEDDDYQPKCKIIKPSNSGCGLFSMLPDPKNKKTSKASTTISMVPRATMQNIKNVKENPKPKTLEIKCFDNKPIEHEDEADDDDDQEDGDFLGLNKINEVLDVAPISGFDLPEIQTNTTIIEEDRVYGPVYCSEADKSDLYEEDETKLILDSNALKQLSDPSKTQIKQVDVINVDMRQVMEESQQWLQKNITEEYAESKNISSDINISGQSKRKHQITYLAQQAKANELKLKNMWAENRMTRKQTQAKYGF